MCINILSGARRVLLYSRPLLGLRLFGRANVDLLVKRAEDLVQLGPRPLCVEATEELVKVGLGSRAATGVQAGCELLHDALGDFEVDELPWRRGEVRDAGLGLALLVGYLAGVVVLPVACPLVGLL